jgi:hypothetical protein
LSEAVAVIGLPGDETLHIHISGDVRRPRGIATAPKGVADTKLRDILRASVDFGHDPQARDVKLAGRRTRAAAGIVMHADLDRGEANQPLSGGDLAAGMSGLPSGRSVGAGTQEYGLPEIIGRCVERSAHIQHTAGGGAREVSRGYTDQNIAVLRSAEIPGRQAERT